MKIKLNTSTLYILSGAPGSGKSTFIKSIDNLPKEAIVSSDAIRSQIFGVRDYLDKDSSTIKINHNSSGDKTVFSIMEQIVEERLKEGLVTIVDSTNTTEKERLFWARIAQKHSIPSEVILFNIPLETLIERDSKRLAKVGAEVISKFYERLETDSELKLSVYDPEYKYSLSPPELPDNVDIVGDIHGLYSDLLSLITQKGYYIENDYIKHPENRKILFLGDWVDRGKESIKCFELIYNSVIEGGHFAVMGNHEHKLLKSYKKKIKTGTYSPRSFSGAETMVSLWENISEEKQVEWMKWLETLPTYYVKDRFIFCHADLSSADIYQLPKSSAFYGESGWGKVDTDASFTKLSRDLGVNGPILVRGHIPNFHTPVNGRVFSLENKVGFSGTISLLSLDSALNEINEVNKSHSGLSLEEYDFQVASIIIRNKLDLKTEFNYSTIQKENFSLLTDLRKLVANKKIDAQVHEGYGFTIFNNNRNNMNKINKDEIRTLEDRKLVQHKTNEEGLEIYKYSKRVFFDSLWDESPLLLHTRGLVLDAAGKIIQNPFVKIFNYGEKNSGSDLSDDYRVRAIEKLNGFLGCVTNHPYKEGELLVTTTGSFDSDFVKYINDFITDDLKAKLHSHTIKNGQTLMFEVIHPEDPHIIPYAESEQGLYLIGARSKDLNAPLVSEQNLDVYANDLGLSRPKHFETTLGEIRKLVDTVKHEGFIIRDLFTDEPLLKFKSSHYLTVKFLGRMGQGQSKLMFEKPEFFKQKIDEEYYPIVDMLVKDTNFNEFTNLPSESRVELVHNLIHKMWAEVHTENKQSNKPKL